MIRHLLLLLAVLGLTAAAPARRDWTQVVNRTPAGTYVLGNPAAPVKLTEYVSLTCPHCAAFLAQSAPTLRAQWVRSGSVSIEVHNEIRDGLDLAAVLVARCAGTHFFAVADAMYASQPEWYARGAEFQQTNAQRLEMYPAIGRLREYAGGAGLIDLARAHGLSPAAADACFANEADMNRVLDLVQHDAQVQATPSFAINGRFIGSTDWAHLEPQLRAAGAH